MKGTCRLIRRRTVPVMPGKLPAATAGPSLANFSSAFTWSTKPGRVTGRVFRGPASRRTLPPSPPVAAPERPDKALVAEERMDGRALPDGTVLQSMPTQPSRPQAIYFARLKSCGAFDRREGLRQVLMWL